MKRLMIELNRKDPKMAKGDTPIFDAAGKDVILRVSPGPSDINSNGHIFGGWVLSQMDIAGGIVAGRACQGACATVGIDAMEFIAPILLRDLISVYATIERRGRTSLAIRIDVIAQRDRGQTSVQVTSGVFTFVALDDAHRPREIDWAKSL
jgi:acyl-CoA thioesterase YciA